MKSTTHKPKTKTLKANPYEVEDLPANIIAEPAAVYGAEPIQSLVLNFRKLRDAFGITQQEMRSLLGVSVRKISGLETGEQRPTTDDLRRFNELSRLREELTHVMEAEAIGEWLQSPNQYFGGASPIQIIERGEVDRLWRLIWRLQDGVPLD